MRPLVNSRSPLTHASMTASSHTDESDIKPSHAPQAIFMPVATLLIFRIGYQLRICLLAYCGLGNEEDEW